MNYIDYINSKDVRAYLMSIDYKPSLLESAFFIYQSKFKTLAEKFNAWNALIEETDDLILDENVGDRWAKSDRRSPATYGMSTHSLIRKYMHDEKLIWNFFESENENYVYLVEFTTYRNKFIGEARRDYYTRESDMIFGKLQDAKEYCQREIKEDDEIVDYSITKKMISIASDEYSNYLKTRFNLSGEVMSVYLTAMDYERYPAEIRDYLKSEQELSAECDFFEAMWFDIPVPFKKGDIVVAKLWNWGRGTEPFVLMSLDPEWRKRKANEGKPYREGTDSSDMIATGWSIGFGENPTEIFDDEMANYLDIEYYREDFKGIERLLPLLALQVKGDIDLWEWEIIKNEIIRTSLPNPKLEYMMSFQNVSKILEGSSVYIE